MLYIIYCHMMTDLFFLPLVSGIFRIPIHFACAFLVTSPRKSRLKATCIIKETHQHQTVSLLIYLYEGKMEGNTWRIPMFCKGLQIPGYPKSDHQTCVPNYGYLMIPLHIPYASKFRTPYIPKQERERHKKTWLDI